MPNPIIGEKMTESSASGARNAAASGPEALLDNASQIYHRTSDWISENLDGRTMGVMGLVAVAGVLGYFAGRSGSRSLKDIGADIGTDIDSN